MYSCAFYTQTIMAEKKVEEIPFIGPIREKVPVYLHSYISEDTLNSYLTDTAEHGRILMETKGVPGVLARTKSDCIYPSVVARLNRLGKQAVEQVHPWVLLCLIDLEDLDRVICEPETPHVAGSSETKSSTTSAPTIVVESNQVSQTDHQEKSSDPISASASSEASSSGSPQASSSGSLQASSSGCSQTSSTDCLQTSSTDCSSKANDKWSTEATRYLLGLYKDNIRKFDSPFCKKKSVWKQISDCMEEAGYLFDSTKCERKVLNLKAQFKKVKVHNNKSGNEPKSCPFYEELNEMFQKDPSITPISTCSNLINQSEEKNPRKQVSVCMESKECSDQKKKQLTETNIDKQPKKKQKKSDIIISLLEKQQERDQERTALLKEMRDQQREQTNRFLNIFEKALCGKSDVNNNESE